MNQFFNTALKSFKTAESELMRPGKDVVALCACQSSRQSACDFLRSYLLSKISHSFENSSLSDLQYQCAKIDPHFNLIDLSCFDCRNDEPHLCNANYCLSVKKVNECFEKTNAIRKFVSEKMKTTENK